MYKSCTLYFRLSFHSKCKTALVKRALKTNAKVKLNHNESLHPIISCKRPEFNLYVEDLNKPGKNNLNPIVLASKGWHRKESRGDYFIIHTSSNRQVLDPTISYSTLQLNKKLVENLAENGIVNPADIQTKAIPVLLAKKNCLIAAETGCGKTLAYLLPALQQILEYKQSNKRTNSGNNNNNNASNLFNTPLCLILTPGRELAYQIENVAQSFVKDLDIKTDVIVGGGTKRKMLNPSFKEIDLLVGTPGAISKLTTTGIFRMNQVRHVILDEADTLLDESFAEKMAHFLKKFPFQYSGDNNLFGTQLTICSATLLATLPNILSEIIVPESLVHVTTDYLHKIIPNVPQRFLRLNKSTRPSHLLQLVKRDVQKNNRVIVFSNTSVTCDWISMFLNENGVKCVNLNGDMPLNIRKDTYQHFRNGDALVLSCTDIGSRGLDTTKVKHVVNFDFPKYTADYIHRCGRIGRIGSPENCHVTNFVCSYSEIETTKEIEMAVRRKENLPKVNGNISGIIRNNMLKSMREQP